MSRLVFVAAAAVVVTVLAVAAGAFGASERVGQSIERARVANLLGTLMTTTEANLSIGLNLDQIALLQTLVEREKASDPAILAIDVFNTAGRSIYSTDRSAVGEKVGETWVRRLGDEGTWEVPERNGETVFGTAFQNDLGVAGGITVTVSGLASSRRAETLGLDLGIRALALAGVGILVAALAAIAFGHLLTRPFEQVARILRGEATAAHPRSGLEQLAVETRQTWAKAETRVDRGLGHLGALDDAA